MKQLLQSGFDFSGGISKLKETRAVFLPSSGLNRNYKFDVTDEDLPVLIKEFTRWLEDKLYLVFKNDDGQIEFHKASKRGNDVYTHRIKKRIDSSLGFLDESKFEKLLVRNKNRKYFTNVIFLSLTQDTKLFLGNRHQAWLNVSYYLNKFKTNFGKKANFGKSVSIRVLESTKRGFPDVHLIIFLKKPVEVFPYVKNVKGKEVLVYLLKNKQKIANYWHSFTEVYGVTSTETLFNYILKDILKQSRYRTYRDKLSLALNWLYEKRSIAITNRKLLREFTDLINLLSIPQTETLANQVKEQVQKGKKFLGLVVLKFSEGIPPPFMFKTSLSDEKMLELFGCMNIISSDLENYKGLYE